MATIILRPNGIGIETNIDLQSPNSTEHWDKVDEVVADDATTFVENKSGGAGVWQRDLYTIPVYSSSSGLINSVTVYVRTRHNASDAKASIHTHSTTYDSPVLGGLSAWTTLSYSWTTNPYTGITWTWAEVDALQIGVSLNGSTAAPDWSRCTQVYVEIITPFFPRIFYF